MCCQVAQLGSVGLRLRTLTKSAIQQSQLINTPATAAAAFHESTLARIGIAEGSMVKVGILQPVTCITCKFLLMQLSLLPDGE